MLYCIVGATNTLLEIVMKLCVKIGVAVFLLVSSVSAEEQRESFPGVILSSNKKLDSESQKFVSFKNERLSKTAVHVRILGEVTLINPIMIDVHYEAALEKLAKKLQERGLY